MCRAPITIPRATATERRSWFCDLPDAFTPSRSARIAIAFLAGLGATGISAILGLIGTYVVIDLPLVDPSALILMAPLVVIPGLAAALLGGRAVIAAIAAGAVAGPIGAMLAIAGTSCDSNMFAAIGLAAAAAYALVIAGLAAFAGDRIGGSDWVERNRGRGVLMLIVVGSIGVIGWIPTAARFGGCP